MRNRIAAGVAAATLAALALTGCLGKQSCAAHGGVKFELHGVYTCNDGYKTGL